ncbi:MAG: hypothetical protein WBW58_12460, partial [Candidatus Acidiferrum sp.]
GRDQASREGDGAEESRKSDASAGNLAEATGEPTKLTMKLGGGDGARWDSGTRGARILKRRGLAAGGAAGSGGVRMVEDKIHCEEKWR